jgi:hypothetical protein
LAKGWRTNGSEFESQQSQEFSVLHFFQIFSRTHAASYTIGTGDKTARAEADHSNSTNSKAKKM